MGSWLVPVTSWKNRGRVYSFGSQGGARRAWSPLFLDQTEAPRAEKNFVETAPPPPPCPTLSQGLDLAMAFLEDATRGY